MAKTQGSTNIFIKDAFCSLILYKRLPETHSCQTIQNSTSITKNKKTQLLFTCLCRQPYQTLWPSLRQDYDMKSLRGTRKEWPDEWEQTGAGFYSTGRGSYCSRDGQRSQSKTGMGQGQTATHAQQKKMGQSRTSKGALVATQLLKAFIALVTLNSTWQLVLSQRCTQKLNPAFPWQEIRSET